MTHGTNQGNQRADSKNPNNPASKSAEDNRANQLNPNNPEHPPSQDDAPEESKK